jgi:Nuclease-related domain
MRKAHWTSLRAGFWERRKDEAAFAKASADAEAIAGQAGEPGAEKRGTDLAAEAGMVFPGKSKKQPLLQVRRRAGQSIRDEKERLTDNRLIPFYFSTAFLWLLWGLEELRVRTHQIPAPKLFLSLAIIATGVSAIVFGRLWRNFRNLNRGERGELRVAEILDDLRSFGYRAFHDLTGDGFNIDHVVVGPAGVFAIETKFRSGGGEIEFRNGEELFVGGYPEEKDCLKQARGNALDVNRIIRENCGINRWVTPLLVFVGDWKIKNRCRDTDALVFSTDQIADYFDRQQPELMRREIDLICSHLERSVKS